MSPAAEEQPVPEYHGRKYRSKKQRPCDLCRSRKIQCKLQDNQTACELCKRLNRRCAFVLGPVRRKYRARTDQQDTGANDQQDTIRVGEDQHQHHQQRQASDVSVVGQNGQNGQQLLPASFDWLPLGQDDHDSIFPPPNAPNLLALNWPDVDFPMGDVLPEQLLSSTVDPSANDTRLPDDEINMRRSSQATSASSAPFITHRQDREDEHQASLSPRRVPGPGLDDRPDWPPEFSIDMALKGHSSMLVGLSSEFDPFFLRHYLYDVTDIYRMYRLHIRKVVDDEAMPRHDYAATAIGASPHPAGSAPVQFVICDEEIWKDDAQWAAIHGATASTDQSDAQLLDKLVPTDLGGRLIRLYTQFVHPSNPIFSLSELSQMMPESVSILPMLVGLRSAVYALAAPFTFLDDELSVSKGYLEVPTDDLWAIALRSYHRASRQSHLSLLQLCLLLLQMPPQNFVVAEPPSFWNLSCSAVAIAETLGLNIDPSDWRVPRREVILRRRLWWLTYSTHMWLALVCSRPSHINDDNWDVSGLRTDDFETEDHDDPEIRESLQTHVPISMAHCELSIILADALREFYTLRAVRGSPSLPTLLNRAQPLRTRIEAWRQTLPFLSKPASELTEEEFEKGAGLRLAHLTVEILIFRALLRPLLSHAVSPTDCTREPISTILENCFTCAKVATEMVSSLRAKHFAAFWPHYVRYQLCYVSTFILMNLAQSPKHEMAVRYQTLLGKWRTTLRIQARAWPLARLATIRLDAIFWKGLSAVVHGAGPDSPAMMLLKDQGSRGSGEG